MKKKYERYDTKTGKETVIMNLYQFFFIFFLNGK